MALTLQDPQIVNGLQSSREIYKYFHGGSAMPDDNRTILVRVILTSDPSVRNKIVKATNSQNAMNAASLRGVDDVHLDIEEYFKTAQLYYDRRKGFYRDQGMPIASIVTIFEVLQAIVAIVLQRPDDARARPGVYVTRDSAYKLVFGANRHPLPVYLACVRIMRRVNEYLDGTDLAYGDKRNLRFYVGMEAVCSVLASVEPTKEQIGSLDLATLDDKRLKASVQIVWEIYHDLGGIDSVSKGTDLLDALKSRLRAEFGAVTSEAGSG